MLDKILKADLLKEMGFDQLDKDKQGRFLMQMNELVEKRLMLTLLSYLTEDDKNELDRLLEAGQEIETFLREKIPNYEDLVLSVIASFKKEMLDLNQALRT